MVCAAKVLAAISSEYFIFGVRKGRLQNYDSMCCCFKVAVFVIFGEKYGADAVCTSEI